MDDLDFVDNHIRMLPGDTQLSLSLCNSIDNKWVRYIVSMVIAETLFVMKNWMVCS